MGYGVVMVSDDDPGTLARFARARGIGFALLSDSDSRLIRAFDVLDGAVPEGAPWHGIARPIIFVIGPDGVITHRFSESDYTVRPDPGAVLDSLR